ncbi:MAG: hypothetical protein K8R76_09780 [Candidatus Aegiribacteria sp.]|nr:hypothetical protein [Candidatus Aegiribacteria sp.]
MKSILITLCSIFLIGSACGPSDSILLPDRTILEESESCRYVWQENDGWAFIAWAMDIQDGAEILAIQSGYLPQDKPQPGEEIRFPFPGNLSDALERRLYSARLVREATEKLGSEDTLSVCNLLRTAMDTDPSWSVPAYNFALILLETEGPDSVLAMLQPWSHKFDAALIQSEIAWNNGNPNEALRQLEICLMAESPPFEALAAAALIYTVTGHIYQASGIWREILASHEADASIRLMAVKYAIIFEQRQIR